nr:cation diffusion facilitator family transporter [uncultured Blautia sp.]
MIQLLAKIFIKNQEDVENPKVRQAYGVLCGTVGIVLNILLFAGKWLAGFLSGSIAITADAFNNLSDAGSSVLTLIGFHLSGQKPDQKHPFGHGRMEYISGLFVSVAILIMAVELIQSSVHKLIHPEAIEGSPLILAILMVSVCVKVYMAYYNKKIGKKINSAAMAATAADSMSDTIATSAVLFSTVISMAAGVNLDGWCGLLVGVFILYSGVQALKDTVDPLLGQAPDKALVEQIQSLVTSYPVVQGIHDMMIHDYGPGRRIVSLHAEVDAKGDILKIHDEIDNIERKLRETLNCHATIHMDPVEADNEEVRKLRLQTAKLIAGMELNLSIHDFRVVKGETHTNLIFDVVVPFECPLKDSEVIEKIEEGIQQYPGNYYAVIQIDRDLC